jgi:hyperosmotically inducible periplasmic protein
MKSLLFLILGIIIGAAGYHYLAMTAPPVGPDPRTTAERARDGARGMGDRVSQKLAEWNLSGDDIRRELADTGQVVRQKARQAGARIDDARIKSVIKAKYVLDDQLKALDIGVEVRDGHVRLHGHAMSEEAVGRAVAQALETDGVVEVNSELAIRATAPEVSGVSE